MFKKVEGIYNVAKQAFKSRGKNPTSGVINTVPIAKSLKERRGHFEDLVKGTDKYTKSLTEEGKIQVKKTVQPAAKKISKIMDKKDTIEKKAKGGRVGLKRGTGLMKKKSDIQKIKETFSPKKSAAKKSTKFGMLSVKAGIDKNPNPTQADRIAGAKMKNKKRFV